MAQYGVNVACTTSYRGVQQPFGYTFHYDTPLPAIDSVLDGLLDAVVAKLKPMHYSSVSFVYGRVWTSGGTKEENQMRIQKPLTGTGTNANAPIAGTDKERAFLVRLRAGVDTRGRPVYLRKWFHLDIGSIGGGGTLSTSHLQQTAALNGTQRAQLVTWTDDFKAITSLPQVFNWVAESGREITGESQAHAYYEHHQLGDKWRNV